MLRCCYSRAWCRFYCIFLAALFTFFAIAVGISGLAPGFAVARPIQVCSPVAVPNVSATMSQRTWALSQDANKSSGVCCVCRATRQLHHKDGKVHRHGPCDKPCPGSNKLPICASQQLGTATQSQSSVSLPASQTGSPSITVFCLVSSQCSYFQTHSEVCSPGVRFSFGQTVPRRRSTTKHLY